MKFMKRKKKNISVIKEYPSHDGKLVTKRFRICTRIFWDSQPKNCPMGFNMTLGNENYQEKKFW